MEKHSRVIRQVRDLAIYMLVIITGFLVRLLPRSASLWLGAGIGDFVYRYVKRRRQIALSNLSMAFKVSEREDDEGAPLLSKPQIPPNPPLRKGGTRLSALYPFGKGGDELRRIARHSFQNMGKTLVEFLSFPKYSLERLLGLARIEGVENLQQAMAAGKGVIAVSAHFGNWELVLQAVVALTDHTSAIVQSFKYHRLDRLVNSYRTRYGGNVIEKKMAVKQSLRLLRQGMCVAIMGDQNAGDSGVFVNFFGVPASTPRGPITFALRTGAPVLSIFDVRQDDDSHLITISKPLDLEISGDMESDVEVNTARLVKQLEKMVQRYPCQWLWMHNRWKTRPGSGYSIGEDQARVPASTSSIQHPVSSIQHPASSIQHTVLVLSDGKPGHYNQSLGVIDRMTDVSVKTIEVRFKRKWRDDLLRVSTRLLAGTKLPRNLIKAMLEWAMESPLSAAVLEAGHFDVILSTGSSVAAPNLLLSRLMGAKTAVCTRPSPVGINHFDLAILPEHMRPRRRAENAVMTLGVPNRITPEYVWTEGINLAKKLNEGSSYPSTSLIPFEKVKYRELLPLRKGGIERRASLSESPASVDAMEQRFIGLLLGGDDRHYSIPPNMVSLLCDTLLDICERIDALLALTTSRRTDPESEDVVRSKLLDNPLCCSLVLASEPQQGNPVPGILGISDVTIVTEDSFSMVCEAASSGKKIVILEVERKKRGHLKRQRVYQLLTERGYTARSEMSNLKDVVLDLVGDPSKPEALDDAQTAANALRELMGL